MFRHRWLFHSVVMLVACATCYGQKASNWRSFKLADQLPESACISVTISPQGKVLVRHLAVPFVSELDGYNVRTIPSPEIGRSRVYQSPGGQLWAVVPEGLQEFKETGWVLHRLPELAGEIHTSSSRVIDPMPLWPVRQGLVLLLLRDQLLEYNCEDPDHPQTKLLREAKRTRLGNFSSLIGSKDGGLWIGGGAGLAKVPGPIRNLKPDTEWSEYVLPESLDAKNLQGLHEDEEGGISAVAESTTNQQRLVVYFDGHDWSAQTCSSERLRQAWRNADRTRWAMSTEALFEADETHPDFTETDEISARAYFDVAVQSGTSFWLATSDGLFRYAPALWRSPLAVRQLTSPIHCLAAESSGALWFTAGSRLCFLSGDQLRVVQFAADLSRNLQPRALFTSPGGAVIMAVEDSESGLGDRLFVLLPGQTKLSGPISPEADCKLRALGPLKDGRLCVQCLRTNGSSARTSFAAFNGKHFEELPIPAPAEMPGTLWQGFYLAQNGDWWLSGEKATAWYSDEKWHLFPSSGDRSTPEDGNWFAELADGRIWCAAPDMIWEFDGHNWSTVKRGFDRIHGMLRSRDGSVWVASNGGLYRHVQGAWIENGIDEGLPSSAVRDVYEDPRGRLWAATSRGLSLFHPEADPDPPKTIIYAFPGPGSTLSEGTTVSLNFSGQDKWKYTARERLLYSYRLDLRDWSPYQELTRVPFSDLPAGKHYFQVRAMDRNGNVDPQPARREFVIVGPWYHETRLVLISCAGTAVALFFAGLAFNRHWRLLRSYAEIERKVVERTRQLEVANRELLHSQKMNALGTLSAGIAHDFNNILSIIKGSTQIIEENLQNPDKIRTRTDRIKLVVEQGAGIVKAMLGFSRDSGKEPALCSLNAVVEDTMKLLGDRFLREVQVDFLQASNLPEILAAKDFIQQILLNFVFNAAESMESNKRIWLSTGTLTELPADLVLLPVPASRYVTVSVRDCGCGIPTENLPRIFEPFFTTKALSTRRGTGLGLSMVYELAKKLGAGLAVASEAGRGSTFTLILPVRDLSGTKGTLP